MTDKKNNSGDMNSGYMNSGYMNSGYWNSGDWNSGDSNSGDRNSGNWNSGNRNSGYWNSGNWNSGDRNSGDMNSGDWNSGNRNSGYLNINEPKMRIFGKETDIDREDLEFPNYFYFNLNEWIDEDYMTDKEKDAYPSYATCGGYLKISGYKQAWKESYEKANEDDKKKTFDITNFNADMFYEISGIDLRNVIEDDKKKDLLKKADELIEKAEELKKEADSL